MPSKLSWLALGVGAYIAFAVANFPAAQAYQWFAPPVVRLAGVTGTVWSGAAEVGNVAGLPLSNLRFRFQPLALLLGKLSGTVEARLPDGFFDTEITATTERISLHELRAATSLQSLREFLPIYGTQGQISLTLDSLEIENGWPAVAVGEARIGQLRVAPLLPTASGNLIELGDYSARFLEQVEPGLSADITDLSGPLELEGHATLLPDRSYSLEGRIRARPEAAPELVQGIEIMTSEPDAEGRRAFTLAGSL